MKTSKYNYTIFFIPSPPPKNLIVYTTNAYNHLEKLTDPFYPTEQYFNELIIYFRASILDEMEFWPKLGRHRKPTEYLHDVLRQFHDTIVLIQRRSEMIHIDAIRQGCVPSYIKWLWEEDRSLETLYKATQEYCRIYNKPFPIIAVHMAEYRAINKLASIIARMITRRTWHTCPIPKIPL